MIGDTHCNCPEVGAEKLATDWQNEKNEMPVKLANWQNEQNEMVKLANWQIEQNEMVKLANWQNEQNEKCLCRFSHSVHPARSADRMNVMNHCRSRG